MKRDKQKLIEQISKIDKPSWKIDFGKHKGKLITTMMNDEEVKYLRWFVNTREVDYSDEENEMEVRYVIFKWWLEFMSEGRQVHPLMILHHFQLN